MTTLSFLLPHIQEVSDLPGFKKSADGDERAQVCRLSAACWWLLCEAEAPLFWQCLPECKCCLGNMSLSRARHSLTQQKLVTQAC